MAHPRKYSSAQKFHPLYRYAGILGFVLAIFLTNRVKPQGGLCNLSLSFLSADKLTTLKYRKHYKFSLESSQENLDTSLLNIHKSFFSFVSSNSEKNKEPDSSQRGFSPRLAATMSFMLKQICCSQCV